MNKNKNKVSTSRQTPTKRVCKMLFCRSHYDNWTYFLCTQFPLLCN